MNKVTEQYFRILKEYFGDVFKFAEKENFDIYKYAKNLVEIYDANLAELTLESLYCDLMKLDWDSQIDYLQNLGGLKSFYMGNGFSYVKPFSDTTNFLKRAGLYTDTIILDDNVLSNLKSWKERNEDLRLNFFLTVHNAIENLAHENLFEDLNPPICALAPSFIWYSDKKILKVR